MEHKAVLTYLEHRVVLGDRHHVGVDEGVVGDVVPGERVRGVQEDLVQGVQHHRVQVALVAHADGREWYCGRHDVYGYLKMK